MPELLLAHCARSIDFVAQNEEWDLGELLDREEGIELSL